MANSYGVLNTKNFQKLLDDCRTNESLRSEVILSLRTSVPTFLSTYFDIHPATEQHITNIAGTDIWGNALATALERGYNIKSEIDDPSRWEFGYDRIKAALDIYVRHYPDCAKEFGVSITISWV